MYPSCTANHICLERLLEEESGDTAFCPKMSRRSYNQKIGSEIMRVLYGAVH